MFIDSHAHYDDKRYNEDRDTLLTDINKSGIDYIINSGADIKSSKKGIALAEKYPFMFAAVGVHPHDADSLDEKGLLLLESLAHHKKVVAIGEIGLDFYYDNSPRDIQRKYFIKQLALAKKLDMPVIIHSREAAMECFNIIKDSGVNKGVIHCYSGSYEMAIDYINLGFHIGLGGVVTYKNARKTLEVAKNIPLSSLLLETDAPYLSPIPKRGERNDSRNLEYIAKTIADERNLSISALAEATSKNAKELFLAKFKLLN